MATLPATVPDLWPALNYEILAPKTILDRQAEFLRMRGKGMLEAEVSTVTGTKDFVIHRLDLIAVQLGEMRTRVLTATHQAEYYPVQIEAACFKPKQRTLPIGATGLMEKLQALPQPEERAWPPEGDWRPVAWDQVEFIAKVGEVLKSAEVRSLLESIIARSNEKRLSANPSAA